MLRITILTVLTILSLVSLSAQEPNKAETTLKRGDEYLQSQNYTEAVKEFEKAISLRPDWAEAYFKLGVAHSRFPPLDKDREVHAKAAIEAFRMALRLRPNWPEAHYELGLMILASGTYDDAAASFKEAIRLKPDFAEAYTRLAITDLYQSRYTEGIERLNEAIRINPNLARAHSLLGFAYLAVENRGQATEQYNLLKTIDAEAANELLEAIQRREKFVFGVKQGRLISNPKPEYPTAARRNRISGAVTVHLVINEEGKVTSAKAVSGPVELHGAAEDAALRARFEPTRLSGKAVTVNGSITYNFVAQ